jgi:hypothetical protein
MQGGSFMSIEPVTGVNPVSPAKSVTNADASQDANDTAAVYEKSSKTSAGVYNANVMKMRAQLDAKYSGLRSLVEKLFSAQRVRAGQSAGLSFGDIEAAYDGNLKDFFGSLQVDNATSLKAQQDISEDGYWGVKQTSQRLIDFAVNVSGGDKTKFAELKAAIEKGFANAEKKWGGALPDICMQTKEATMKGLEAWANANS